TALSVVRPGRTARKVARAGRRPGYPPSALVRRTAVPLVAGMCQANMPRGASTTVTIWPGDSRTVAPLSASVSAAAPVGAGLPECAPVAPALGTGGTRAAPAALAEPPDADAPGEPPGCVPQAAAPVMASKMTAIGSLLCMPFGRAGKPTG